MRKRKIAFISIAAVALCVALLLATDSLLTGFVDKLESADLWTTGDLLFQTESAAKPDEFLQRLREIPEIKCVSPVHYGGGLLRIGTGDVREVFIMGIDMSCQAGITDLRESLLLLGKGIEPLSFNVPGQEDSVGGWVGISALADPDEQTDEYDFDEVLEIIGDRLVLMTAGRVKIESDGLEDGNSGKIRYRPKRKVLAFRISDVFHSGVITRDSTVYLPYEVFYKLSHGISRAGGPLMLNIWLVDGADTVQVKERILGKLWEHLTGVSGSGAREVANAGVFTREENLEGFYSHLGELRKQMSLVMLIFSVICSVAVLLIFCIFYMIVTTKQKDIAIIKSCGTGSWAVTLIFLGFGGSVGVVGSVVGILLGTIVVRNINPLQDWARSVLGFRTWSSSIFVFDKIPNEVCWDSITWIVPAAILACVVGALIPAVSAALAKPVKILHYE
ncbi:MAG: ABC transporter permease [Planctomycetota bacterium]